MKAALILLAAIVIWALAWRFVARWQRSKDSGVVGAHFWGFGSGLVAGIVFLVVAGSLLLPAPSAKPTPISASTAPAIATQATDAASSESTANAADWPKVATATIPESKDETHFLADQSCLDEGECYGPKRFHRFIVASYPDIAKVRYPAANDGDSDDAETIALRKEQFAQGLYFAKQIQLANGQSLFDFMRLCSRGFTANDAAEVAYDEKDKASYFDIRYFPTLRRVSDGTPIELQLLYERRGNKLIATSPFFSSHALQMEDFMKRHGVTCWENRQH